MNTLELLCETKDGRLIVLTINADEVIYHDAYTNYNPEKWKNNRDVHIKFSAPDPPTGGLQIIKRKEIIVDVPDIEEETTHTTNVKGILLKDMQSLDDEDNKPGTTGRPPILHPQEIDHILKMREAKWTIQQIADDYKVDKSTLSRFIMKHDPTQADKVKEKYYSNKVKRTCCNAYRLISEKTSMKDRTDSEISISTLNHLRDIDAFPQLSKYPSWATIIEWIKCGEYS